MSSGEGLIEGWNDDQLAEFQAGGSDGAAKCGEVVLVAAADLLDEAMEAKSLEHPRELRWRDSLKAGAQGARLESADGELAVSDGLEEIQIGAMKEIEAAIAPIAVAYRRGDFLQGMEAGTGVIDGSEEIEVAIGGGTQEMKQGWQAVDRLAHRSELEFRGTVAMFHRAVVLEKGHVISGAFGTPDKTKLIIELDSHGPHVMLDARALDSSMEVVTDLPLVGGGQFASQESDDVLRLDGVDGSVGNGGIEGLEVGLAPEDNVGGVLHLHQAPVIPRSEISGYRTVPGGYPVQVLVESPDIEVIGERLGAGEVGDIDEGVFQRGAGDAFFLKLGSQLIMPVEIELKAERCPGWHPQVAKPQFGVDEVEVVMQTLGFGGSKGGLATGLVMPGLERGTGFHCREDVDQTGVITALGDDRLDALLLPEAVAPDELDVQPVLSGEFLGVSTDLLPELLGEQWIVEEANTNNSQVPRHGLGVADIGERTCDHHPVKARQGATNLGCMSVYERLHRVIITQSTFHCQENGGESLFGSG